MSTIQTNAIIDASGGNTATVNGVTPNSDSLKGKNLFKNGDFQVWQRGTSLTHSADKYLADRWKVTPPGTANTTSAQVFDTTLQQNTLKITVNQAGYIQFQHGIEGFKWAHNKAITVSFWAKADTNMRCTFNKRLYHAGGSVVLTTSPVQTITTTLTKFTVTFNGDDFSGYTEDATSRLQFGWTVNSPSNGNLASGNDFYIGQAKAEIGDVATAFQSKSYGEELALCQRYFQVSPRTGGSLRWTVTYYNTRAYAIHQVLPMRALPTVTDVSTGTSTAASFNLYAIDGDNMNSSSTSGNAPTLSAQGLPEAPHIIAAWDGISKPTGISNLPGSASYNGSQPGIHISADY